MSYYRAIVDGIKRETMEGVVVDILNQETPETLEEKLRDYNYILELEAKGRKAKDYDQIYVQDNTVGVYKKTV